MRLIINAFLLNYSYKNLDLHIEHNTYHKCMTTTFD